MRHVTAVPEMGGGRVWEEKSSKSRGDSDMAGLLGTCVSPSLTSTYQLLSPLLSRHITGLVCVTGRDGTGQV